MSYLPVFTFCIIIFVIAISSLKNSNLALQSSESAFAIIQIWQQGSWRFFSPVYPLFPTSSVSNWVFFYYYLRYKTLPTELFVIMYAFSILRQAFPFFFFFLFLILFFNRFLNVFYVIPRRVLQTEIDMLVLSDALTLVFFFWCDTINNPSGLL